jgi:hypothetical protein
MAALAARVASVRSELAVLAGEVSEKLDDMDAVIEGSHTTSEEVADSEGDVVPGDHSAEATTHDEVEGEVSDEGSGADDEVSGGGDGTETGTTNGADHLDEILTGVATDLQLDTDEPTVDADESTEPTNEAEEPQDSEQSAEDVTDGDYGGDEDEQTGL